MLTKTSAKVQPPRQGVLGQLTPFTAQLQNGTAFNSVVPQAQELSVSDANSRMPEQSFERIISEAQQRAVSAGDISAVDHEASQSGGRATYTKKRFVVKPSTGDFLADVQLAAQRSLSSEEFAYFKFAFFGEYLPIADMQDRRDVTADGRDKYFVEFLTRFSPQEQERISALDTVVREKVGAAFIERGIFPIEDYMNVKGEDIRKRYEN